MLRERTVPTPSVEFTVAPRGFQRGHGQYPLWRPTHPLVFAACRHRPVVVFLHPRGFAGSEPVLQPIMPLDLPVTASPPLRSCSALPLLCLVFESSCARREESARSSRPFAECALTNRIKREPTAGGGTSLGEWKRTSLNSTCLIPKPLASSVYVHVPEAPSPHERSISVMSLFPSFVPIAANAVGNEPRKVQIRVELPIAQGDRPGAPGHLGGVDAVVGGMSNSASGPRKAITPTRSRRS